MQSSNGLRDKAIGWHGRLESSTSTKMRAGAEGRPSGSAHGGGGGTWRRPAIGSNPGWGERAAAADGRPARLSVGPHDEEREWDAWEERKKEAAGLIPWEIKEVAHGRLEKRNHFLFSILFSQFANHVEFKHILNSDNFYSQNKMEALHHYKKKICNDMKCNKHII
jgi:hypothetical protein